MKKKFSGGKKLANRKKNKLDIYAETRLWNLKLQNRNVSTHELMDEMISRFSLKGGMGLYPFLQKVILAARRRVMRRRTEVKNNIKTWSEKLFLPEPIVAEWAWKGFLTEENFAAVAEILSSYRALMDAGKI
jgi:superfamily I DNA/RNA helicase